MLFIYPDFKKLHVFSGLSVRPIPGGIVSNNIYVSRHIVYLSSLVLILIHDSCHHYPQCGRSFDLQ